MSSLAVLSVTGCLTKKLYETRETKYAERAVSFLLTEDGSKLVVLGEKSHYIFDDFSPSLKHLLGSPLRAVTEVELLNFRVRTDNVVTGDYTCSFSSRRPTSSGKLLSMRALSSQDSPCQVT